MADIYVDPSRATNGSGSFSDPRNAWPTGIGAADRILLKRGTRLTVSAQLSMGGGSNNIVCDYGDSNAPRPIITSTAGNQGLINVNVAGVTTFRNIHFDQCLNMGANGGVLAAQQVSGGRAANLAVYGCRFSGVGVNAVLLNGANTATLSSTFECIGNEFDDIGADCVFGGALDYVFAYNRCTNLSTRGTNGDGVGFINGDPVRVWIHHNYIDHSRVDSKQCIIIDSTTPGSGLCIIEDNVLIGYGSESAKPALHNVIISDPVTKIRRNLIYTFGIACGANTAQDEISGNLIIVGNTNNLGPAIALSATGARFVNNTVVGIGTLDPTKAALIMGNPATAALVSNNIFSNLPIAVQSNVVGINPACSNNAYWNVATRRLGSGGAFAEANEVLSDPLLDPVTYRPLPGSPLIGAGVNVGPLLDKSGKRFARRPSIGAYEFVRSRSARV